jgi:uncharacterized membrane protein YgcG
VHFDDLRGGLEAVKHKVTKLLMYRPTPQVSRSDRETHYHDLREIAFMLESVILTMIAAVVLAYFGGAIVNWFIDRGTRREIREIQARTAKLHAETEQKLQLHREQRRKRLRAESPAPAESDRPY